MGTRGFSYPLNVFMHVLTREEGSADYLHYGLFESAGESIAAAQEHSTELLLERLPPPPCRILDVGTGLGTTLKRLVGSGYEAIGITPDEQQIAVARARHGEAIPVLCAPFEFYDAPKFDVVVFQESAQYIESEVLFSRVEAIAPRVVVLDEFALRRLDEPGALHSLDRFLEAATRHRFDVVERVDLSARALPTIRYFAARLPRYRESIAEALSLAIERVDELIASGARYLERYTDGTYGYELLDLVRRPSNGAA